MLSDEHLTDCYLCRSSKFLPDMECMSQLLCRGVISQSTYASLSKHSPKQSRKSMIHHLQGLVVKQFCPTSPEPIEYVPAGHKLHVAFAVAPAAEDILLSCV
jgi:hypothetical protein